MKTTLTLLLASTALSGAIGMPAWSMAQLSLPPTQRPFAALSGDTAQVMPLVLASSDEDEDDEDEDEEDEDEDEEDDQRSGGRNPAPAGGTAPPANGLFGTGTAPKAQTN